MAPAHTTRPAPPGQASGGIPRPKGDTSGRASDASWYACKLKWVVNESTLDGTGRRIPRDPRTLLVQGTDTYGEEWTADRGETPSSAQQNRARCDALLRAQYPTHV